MLVSLRDEKEDVGGMRTSILLLNNCVRKPGCVAGALQWSESEYRFRELNRVSYSSKVPSFALEERSFLCVFIRS